MRVLKSLSQRWRELSITVKFGSAFGLLLVLIVMVSITGYISLTSVHNETEAVLLTSTEIQWLVLEMNDSMAEARLLHRDFFLQYPEIGFEKAREIYVEPCVQQIARVVILSDELKRLLAESEVSDALRESDVNLNLYLSSAQRFSDTFLESVELVTTLATPETGLQAQMAQHSTALWNILKVAGDHSLTDLYRDMRSFEKDYWVTRQRPFMQSAFNVAFQLRQAIENTPALEPGQKALAQTHLNNYESTAQEILALNVAIRSKFNDFALQAEAIDPISLELIALAKAEVDLARTRIERIGQLATLILIVIGLAGLLLAMIIARVLNNSITRNVIRLTESASKLQAGNLDVRAQINSADELGQLAGSFDAMAVRIRDLVGDLEQKVAELDQIFNAAADGMRVIDKDFNVLRVNSAFSAISGVSGDELVGKRCYETFLGAACHTPDCPLTQILSGMERVESEMEKERRDGVQVPCIVAATPFRMRDGELIGIVESSKDITERVRAEEELEKHRDHLEDLVRERTAELVVAKEGAEAANRAKSTFLAQMSHELRTPLNAILGYAQILQRRPLEPDVIDALNTVQRSGEHLLTLITDILDITKIEAGRVEIYPVEIHFPNFMDHIASIIRARAAAKGLIFSFEKLSALPVGVQADETRLRQVLLNLLDNAIKFTNEGQVTLRVKQVSDRQRMLPQSEVAPDGQFADAGLEQSAQTCRLTFEVQDTGIGIPPDQLERVFQPFEQVKNVTHRNKGVGLGLAVSRQLVRLMGSKLHVQSELGEGSMFWFEVTLPVTEVVVDATRPPELDIIGYTGPRRAVLVVDDVPSNRALLVDLLGPLGFDVVEAVDGRQAIHLAQEIRPDLILMDRWMPVLDGFEATQQMRQISELTEVPVVAISASVSEEDQVHSQEVGLDAFLPKPVNWPDLAVLLEEHLELEWEYEGEREKGDREEGETVLVPPPQEELTILLDLARRGDMRGMRERAVHLETLSRQYVPFARKLYELAKGFEEKQILALVRQHVDVG